jgi:two-component system, LytTR family, sensor kinase
MKLPIDKERFKIYIKIGAVYLGLSMFGELVKNPATFLQGSLNNLWLVCYVMVVNYVLFEHSVPYVRFRWRRLILVPVLLFIYMMLYSFGFYAWKSIGAALHFYVSLASYADVYKELSGLVPFSFFSVFFFGVALHIYDYRKLKEATQQLRIEKQEAELNYLKSQTNPHFLFNTLNNIYSLARDKSDLTPESILRLSKILRFMLYETGGEYIAIEQEVKVMTDYIALEKLRYDESLRINFNHDLEDMKQSIPPLLLIPLVENAFKHGVSETRDRPFIEIHLSVKSRQLQFVVKNSAEASLADDRGKESIGLNNLRRQLALLYADYDLSVQHRESVFTASLKINLASHV